MGGKFEVTFKNLPTGLGSYAQWDKKLDSAIAGALMSIQAIKGIEIGLGFETASTPGSLVHDEIFYEDKIITRKTNNAGGIEGGMSNGEPILIQCAMKPIPTLYSPLSTFNILDGSTSKADIERSDACAVPAAAVVAEAMTAFVIANFALEKFGSDTIAEVKANLINSNLLQKNLLP